MKIIGILKEIDNIGRIVIPKKLRQRFQLDGSVELLITENGVLIRNPMYKLVEIYKGEEFESTTDAFGASDNKNK